jgi:hypothetical protein
MSSNPDSPIQKLPSELLLTIFKFAYVAARRSMSSLTGVTICHNFNANCRAENKCFCYISPNEKYDWDMHEDSHPAALFPNSLASVCCHWENVMLLLPAFWTRVVIVLDSSTFPPPGLSLQLNSTKDEPIDIIVTRSPKSDALDSDVEQSRMAYIVAVLRPHFQRCRKLHFNVTYSSSLPQLPAILPSIMSHLQQLSLDSSIDTGRPAVQPYDSWDDGSMVNWCKLKSITIDGWNLVDLYKRVPNSREQIFPACKSLAMKFGGEEFPFSNIIMLLRKHAIDGFTFDSVLFSKGENLHHTIYIDELVLKNLSADVTNTIISVCYGISSLAIINCFASVPLDMPVVDSFSLLDIDADQYIGGFIRTWSGADLHVIRCRGFDDDVLNMMGQRDRYGNFYAARMETLSINQCPHFSIEALKKLAKIRGGNSRPREN